MRDNRFFTNFCAAAAGLCLVAAGAARAEDDGESKPAELKIGDVKLQAPSGWKSVKPSSRIVPFELHAPAAEGDKLVGRLTMMSAGGSIEANLERWYNQFEQPDGKKTKAVAKTAKKKVGVHTVHLVDVTGTFLDRPFPMAAEATPRDDYRMLAAIIEAEGGNVFVKFTGPAKTIEEHADAFHKMIESLE
jgi:hypothetical protein